jgi:hypothetical protein
MSLYNGQERIRAFFLGHMPAVFEDFQPGAGDLTRQADAASGGDNPVIVASHHQHRQFQFSQPRGQIGAL